MSLAVTITADIWALPGLTLSERVVLAAHRAAISVGSKFNQTAFEEATGISNRTSREAIRVLTLAGHIQKKPAESAGKAAESTGMLSPTPPLVPPLDGFPTPLPLSPPLIPPTPPATARLAEQTRNAEETFASFWKCYPRKDGRSAALKAWVKILPDGSLAQTIIAAVAVACNSPKWREENGQFIPHASTYLNQRRWEDEGVRLPQSAPGLFDHPAVPAYRDLTNRRAVEE